MSDTNPVGANPIGRTMKAAVAPNPGGPEALQIVERPVPQPGCGEVLIKVAAAGLNGADLLQRQGRYPLPPGATDILGLECSGTVAALGPDAAGFKVGDEVCALLVGGGYAEYVAVPAVQCLKLPQRVGLVEAGGIMEVVMTVWSNVFEIGRLAPGERLLVHGGSSGIGTMAIQLARALGSTVYATAGSAEKCARCQALGAVRAINYKDEDFVEIVKRETQGAGVDVVLEMVGGPYVARDIAALAMGGRIVFIAQKLGSRVEVDFGLVQRKHLAITGSMLRPRPIAEKGRLVAAAAKAVWPLFARGEVKPVIDRTFPLAEAARAHAHMEEGQHIGKVLLTMD
jgi:putative PIG3 family NAD(P)H quinone oxidoreductase